MIMEGLDQVWRRFIRYGKVRLDNRTMSKHHRKSTPHIIVNLMLCKFEAILVFDSYVKPFLESGLALPHSVQPEVQCNATVVITGCSVRETGARYCIFCFFTTRR